MFGNVLNFGCINIPFLKYLVECGAYIVGSMPFGQPKGTYGKAIKLKINQIVYSKTHGALCGKFAGSYVCRNRYS